MAMTTEAPVPALTNELTYDAYMAEPTVYGRYDIVNGVRIFMPGATWDHQEIALNLGELLRGYARSSGVGKVNIAPFDVLIRRFPKMQVRQPDVLFVSFDRLAQIGGRPVKGPLAVAPELVVEIISDSETQRILGDKLADYVSIGVDECWVVRLDAGTVEVLALTPGGAKSVASYGDGEEVQSVVFAGLSVSVADVLAA
jgi:Uma2 family endonuclease